MSLFGLSWVESVAVTLGIAGWAVLSCVVADAVRSRARADSQSDPSVRRDAQSGGDERRSEQSRAA